MLLPNQQYRVKWNVRNKARFIELGYEFTELGDTVMVKAEDLSFGSHIYVKVQCDFCGCVVEKKMHTYNLQHHPKYGDCCAKCQPKKNKLVCMDKYGVDNGSKTQEAIDKIKQTCMDKYGVDNPARIDGASDKISAKIKESYKNEESVEKRKRTNREKYGCDYPSQNEDIKRKQAQTMIERYGVDHPKKSKEIREREVEHNRKKYGVDYYQQTEEGKRRMVETNLKKYGVKYTLQSPKIREKGLQTLYKNGTCPTSKQQIYVCSLLKEIYGNCDLNKPAYSFSLDCFVEVNGEKIDVEYDGWYWHKSRQEQDKKRNYFLMDRGYRILRIRANYELPTKEQLVEGIDYLVKDNHHLCFIDLDI